VSGLIGDSAVTSNCWGSETFARWVHKHAAAHIDEVECMIIPERMHFQLGSVCKATNRLLALLANSQPVQAAFCLKHYHELMHMQIVCNKSGLGTYCRKKWRGF
jgi:hypothetical protein